MRDPELRRKLLAEAHDRRPADACSSSTRRKAFPLGDPPDYEPDPSDERRGARRGRRAATPYELYYDAAAGATTAARS